MLLVEDSPYIADRMRELLEMDTGICVALIVADEAAAIAASRAAHYDVMVLDLELATGTGFGVMEALGDGKPKTIVLTNHAHPQYRRRALALGALHFLDKSKEFARLPEILAELRASSLLPSQ